MKISVMGLGYVGAVSAACLVDGGHTVIGVDPNETKVELINNGESPIVETGLAELIAEGTKSGKLRATTNLNEAVLESELSLICVGTPSQINGSLDLSYVRRVCEQIGSTLKEKGDYHVVVIRSTMLPGSINETVIPALEMASGLVEGNDFGVCINPEFLRESTAIYDYHNPPKTVIGETNEKSGDLLAALYDGLDAPLIRTDVATAEMVKYTDNVWHALKVCFANEIGDICKEVGLDGHEVMNIFCQDTKLNISPYYMKPGFAFGGSCLPKDVRALNYKAKSLDLDLPIISSINPSNAYQIERGLKMIMDKESKQVGVLGFSFKAGTDDLRESPIVEIIERLLGKGYQLKIYDQNVRMASIVGANKDYILNKIPHISALMTSSIDEVIAHSDTIIIGNNDPEFKDILTRIKDGQVVIDFVRISENKSQAGIYDGICW